MFGLVAAIVGFVVGIGALLFYGSDITTPPQGPNPETPAKTNETHPDTSGVPALTSINRSNQHLNEMPKDILSMTQVQHLDLSNNQLTGSLPAEIRHLSKLEILNISGNQMTGLPAELGQLSKLRILNAANNQLTGLPHELGNLQNLELLDLSGNDVSDIDLNIIRQRLPASVHIRL